MLVMLQDEALWKHLAAGFFAGAVSRTCTAPLDRIKVFLQVRGAEYKGVVNCLRVLNREGGLLSFWRGNGINVLKVAPEHALKFMAYEHAKRFIRGYSNRDLNIIERFFAGAYAGIFSQSVIYPMEVIKTKLVLGQTGDHQGILNCAWKIKHSGWTNFYRGFPINLVGIIPYAGVDLAVYETLKRTYMKSHYNRRQSDIPQIYVMLACGVISSTFGQLCSYPFALVRTRMQASVLSDSRASAKFLVKQIWNKEGLRGFYRGIFPNTIKVAPAVSISYVVYEEIRGQLGAEMC